MNFTKLFSLSLVLALLLSMSGVLAYGCSPESKDCLGNAPAGTIVQGQGNWLLDFIAALTKGLSVSGSSTATTQTYTYKFGYGDLGDLSSAQTFPWGISDGCELLYQCGDTHTTIMHSNIGYINYPVNTYTLMTKSFECQCDTTGKIWARVACSTAPLVDGYYTAAWSTVQAATCASSGTVTTPVPCINQFTGSVCQSNAIYKTASNCGATVREFVQSCQYGCNGNVCAGAPPIQTPVPTQPPVQPTQPPVIPTAVPTGTPLVTVTSTPDVYGNCPAMPRADCITLGLSGGCPLYQCPQVQQPPTAGFNLAGLSTYHVIGILVLVFMGAMYLKKGRK